MRKTQQRSAGMGIFWMLALTQALACSSSSDGDPARAGAGSDAGGASAMAGSINSAGSFALAGNSGTRDSGGAGTSGSGASAGSIAGAGGLAVVIPPDNFNPAIPSPSFDCRTFESTKRCVSIRGTINGVAVDTHCSSEAVDNVTFDNPLAWVADCLEGESAQMGRRYQVSVPVQKPGMFSYELAPAAPYAGASMTVQVNLVGGSSVADHYAGGALSGVASDGEFGLALVLGSFNGTWNAPASASCNPHISMGQCGGPSSINGTFKMLHIKGVQ